jgi:hypothetical protein
MTIVRLKTDRDRKVNELLKTFGLPGIEYPNGEEAKPSPELVGASEATNPTEALGLRAVNELLRWTRRSV